MKLTQWKNRLNSKLAEGPPVTACACRHPTRSPCHTHSVALFQPGVEPTQVVDHLRPPPTLSSRCCMLAHEASTIISPCRSRASRRWCCHAKAPLVATLVWWETILEHRHCHPLQPNWGLYDDSPPPAKSCAISSSLSSVATLWTLLTTPVTASTICPCCRRRSPLTIHHRHRWLNPSKHLSFRVPKIESPRRPHPLDVLPTVPRRWCHLSGQAAAIGQDPLLWDGPGTELASALSWAGPRQTANSSPCAQYSFIISI
jgi:hypothetical protein